MKVLTTNFPSYDKHEYAKSAVLYVLSHFKPNLNKKSMGKHYLKKTTIDLFPDEQPDLFKIIYSDIDYVTNKVGFDDDWFSIDNYLALWKKNFTKFLNEHTEVQESLDSFISNSNDIYEQFEMIIDSLSKLSSIMKISYDEWHQKSMAEFLDSDLPLELYNLYNISYIEKISAIRSLVGDLMRLRNMLHLVRSDERKIKNLLAKFEKNTNTLSKSLTELSRSELILKFYLCSKNAKNLDDFFKAIPLKLDKNSEVQFRLYFNSFRSALFTFTKSVDRKYLDENIVLNSSKSESFIDFDEKLRTIVLKHG